MAFWVALAIQSITEGDRVLEDTKKLTRYYINVSDQVPEQIVLTSNLHKAGMTRSKHSSYAFKWLHFDKDNKSLLTKSKLFLLCPFKTRKRIGKTSRKRSPERPRGFHSHLSFQKRPVIPTTMGFGILYFLTLTLFCYLAKHFPIITNLKSHRKHF